MDTQQLLSFLEPVNQWASDHPFWTGLIVLVMYGIFFGKKKDYELEAKLFFEGQNQERGELEFKKYSKDAVPTLELQLLKPDVNLVGSIDINLNDQKYIEIEVAKDQRSLKVVSPIGVSEPKKQSIHISPKWKTQTLRTPVNLKNPPKNHDKVVVHVDGKKLVGVLVVD
jgi:hypothetical protein